MENFNMFNINEERWNLLIALNTNDSPFDLLDEIQQALEEIHFKGNVLFDQMLHTGNTEERFICASYYDGIFEQNSFRFVNVEKKNVVRRYLCEYLKADKDMLLYSCLTEQQQKLIESGCII